MNTNKLVGLALLAVLTSSPAVSQETSNTSVLPAICNAVMPAAGNDDHASHGGAMMSPGHMAMNAGLDEMHAAMQAGMQAENLDVAFVCGMIPHHQGAITMAKAQLEHGEDEWVKQLSRQIIEAQEREIGEMIDWLEKRQ